ncbi:hypothetical protein C672_3603 [[Clostridium] bifermentans ATCC 638]|uniref:Uncharacterized protein n=1 Tax=Paraclostridium bifermentans ATCC 638 = DSM 14991 TaxID=1233171 RepID=T4VGC3_PARBF|nr:hypothetical protein [Paraclostridium bifermentans]EQK39816.1 hypothetical protein C672_3603 [[Clostridium] bifermentans ATCC 638] [Paraclostridium bifermentans ATCC 638 = DSM 14991]
MNELDILKLEFVFTINKYNELNLLPLSIRGEISSYYELKINHLNKKIECLVDNSL